MWAGGEFPLDTQSKDDDTAGLSGARLSEPLGRQEMWLSPALGAGRQSGERNTAPGRPSSESVPNGSPETSVV